MGDKIGYARVSTREQNLDSQLDQLAKAGCTRIFTDKISGKAEVRPGWTELIGFIRSGDVVVVAELSRMSRSLLHFLSTVQKHRWGYRYRACAKT